MNQQNYTDVWNNILGKYDINSFVYDFGDNLRKYHINKLLFEALKGKVNQNLIIMDFGAGNWLYLDEIYSAIKRRRCKGNIELHGFEFSLKAINWGIEKYQNNKPINLNLKKQNGDILDKITSIPNSHADIIITLETLEHIADDVFMIQEYFRILNNEGYLVISVPNKNFLFPSKDWFTYLSSKDNLKKKDIAVGHYRRYSVQSISELLEEMGFNIEKVVCYGFITNDYYDTLFSKLLKKDTKLKRVIFKIFLWFTKVEDVFFNFFECRRSAGIFLICSKTRTKA